MTEADRKQLALLIVDEFLDNSIPFLNAVEIAEDSFPGEFSETEISSAWEEAEDVIRFIRDRTDLYYD